MLIKDDPPGPARTGKVPRFLSSLVRTRRRIAFLIAFVLLSVVVAGGSFSAGVLAYKYGLSGPIDSLLEKPAVALMVERFKPFFFVLRGIAEENIRIPGNYLSSLTAFPENLHIDIKHKHFQKLAHIRDRAIVNRHLDRTDKSYVPAQIRHRDRTYDIKLRLKGDKIDHLHGEKWSYRVKIRSDDTLLGMKTFSIQHPKTRNFIYEWLFHQALKREGVIGLRYKFVNVTVNGTDLGIFALEEHFEKRLLESNERREGPILKFNEDVAWLTGTVSTNPRYAYMTSPIDAFEKSKLLENPNLHAQYRKGISLLEAFRQGELTTSDVFDIDKLARYYAISELMGADHANEFINLRFYYNPVTSRLEPVGFDANAGKTSVQTSRAALWDPLKVSRESGSSTLRLFEEQLFADFEFFQAYMAHLERIVEPAYLELFLREVDADLQENLSILYREFPYFSYDPTLLERNQEILRESINPERALNVWLNRVEPGQFLELEISNVLDVPLEIQGVELTVPGRRDEPDREHRFETESQAIAKPIPFGDYYTSSALFRFEMPPDFEWDQAWANRLQVVFRFLGTTRNLRQTVQPEPRIEEGLASDLTRLAPNPESFDFLEIDDAAKTLRFVPGSHIVDRDLVLPPGYTAHAGPGVKLQLTSGASIASYAALRFVGTADQPVEIEARGGKGQGLFVVKPTAPSRFEHVRFRGLSAPQQHQWGLTGAVTFYGSEVVFQSCEFLDNDSEDALNLIHSRFEITDSSFRAIRSDALDSDFSEGRISRTRFSEIGNDAVDVSGSHLTLNDVTVTDFGDKGLSAGEDSRIDGRNVQILGGAVAVASKDASTIQINGLLIKGSKVGFTAYRKKPEFGHATIIAETAVLADVEVPYLIEKNSQLSLNGDQIVADEEDVESLMYGSVYGKASN